MRPYLLATLLSVGLAIAFPAAWPYVAIACTAFLGWGVVSMRAGIFGPTLWRGDGSRAEVALTFDDGPDPDATSALLDLLKQRGVKATFFVVGERARAHPDIVRRCHAEGHLLGNHSDRHSNWINVFPHPVLRRDLRACQDTVREITGEAPRYYRPPVGLVNPIQLSVSKALGLTPVGWGVRSFDTTPRAPERVATRVLRRVEAGSIVLLHDNLGPRVIEIATRILDGLSERDLTPVRLDALVRSDA